MKEHTADGHPLAHADGAPVQHHVHHPIPASVLATEHVRGNRAAELVIVEYGDFECPACAAAEPVLRRLVERHGDRLLLVWRHFPLEEVHPHALLAAQAAEAAAAQGRFWEMHHLLLRQGAHLSRPAIDELARGLGLDMAAFDAALADEVYLQRVREHQAAGVQAGVRATPGLFLNGAMIDVSFGLDRLASAVETALRGLRA